MSVRTGIVKGHEFKKNRDGTGDRLLLQVQMTDPLDVQTVELMAQAGVDVNPPEDSRIIILDMGPSYKIAVGADDGIVPTVEPGEKKIYSSAGGAIKAFIKWVKDGILHLNGDADNAVKFSPLETAFNQLQSDFDTHVHQYIPGVLSPIPTAAPTNPSTADIAPAKVDTVKLP